MYEGYSMLFRGGWGGGFGKKRMTCTISISVPRDN